MGDLTSTAVAVSAYLCQSVAEQLLKYNLAHYIHISERIPNASESVATP